VPDDDEAPPLGLHQEDIERASDVAKGDLLGGVFELVACFAVACDIVSGRRPAMQSVWDFLQSDVNFGITVGVLVLIVAAVITVVWRRWPDETPGPADHQQPRL
jgi:hypothetical protein